ncbi:MAG TPA: ATP-binding protein [Polyangiaceae bacterium]|nr:ATP-binding protein [Polyangiaceae bacterium]
MGDPTRVRQSLLNLLGNAAKFTQQGHVKVTTTQEPIDGKPWIVFQIEDDGVGMTKEQVVASFEAFQQVDSSTTRKTGGIGLGLALTRQLCELMGGRLEIQSAVGEGTTVTMRLPILDSHRDFMDSIITEAEVQRTP